MNNTEIGLMSGFIIIIGVAVSFYFVVTPSEQSGDIFIIDSGGNGTGETTDCINLSSGTHIIKNSTSGDCFVRTILGSGDISVTNMSNTIIIDFNGTVSGESTQCFNVGGQILIVKNSTSGNCFIKSLASGSGISITNGTDIITITNTRTCTNEGSIGEVIAVSSACNLKRLLAGTGISLSSNSTRITITNSLPEATTASNLGSIGEGVFSSEVGNDLQFKKLVGVGGVSITSNATRIEISRSNPLAEQGTVYQSQLKTNIGATYIDVYITAFDMENMMVIDCDDVVTMEIVYIWDYVGAGTQQVRWVNVANNAQVLYESPTFTTDRDATDSGVFGVPSWCSSLSLPVNIEWQGKSTIAGDDPVAKGYKIMVE